MARKGRSNAIWQYRPTEMEHELLLRTVQERPEFDSVAQFVREAVFRLIDSGDTKPRWVELMAAIDDLGRTKNKFMTLVLDHGEYHEREGEE